MTLDKNLQPHLLIAEVVGYGRERYKCVAWVVECPYPRSEIHDCGVLAECTGSEKDVAEYGCRPYPVEPKLPPGTKPGEDALDDDYRAWMVEVEEWNDEHVYYGDGYGHHAEECWFTHILAEGEAEPEDILKNIPDGPINGPFMVKVHFEGSLDEAEPGFTLWKDDSHDPR